MTFKLKHLASCALLLFKTRIVLFVPLYYVCLWLTLIPIVHFRHVSVLDPILSGLAHHPPFHTLLLSCDHFLSESVESFLAPVLYFCIYSLDPVWKGGWCVCVFAYTYLCMSSNNSNIVCRDSTLLSYPFLLLLLSFLLFCSFPFGD